ncbi:hypothetical protein GCM10009613_60860 [Pseudonocardia kongjuensis]|uniref:DUF7352 domain-containing protein n=1 Tax=Pseudonocardia kongjuensis TaxID=102227 RepID=A0ABN1YBQ7_9PSEU
MAEQTIWRFEDRLAEHVTLTIPPSAEVLGIRTHRRRRRDIEVWVRLNPEDPPEPRVLVAVGTGHPVPDDVGRFVGSVFFGDGDAFAFHFFEVGRAEEVASDG